MKTDPAPRKFDHIARRFRHAFARFGQSSASMLWSNDWRVGLKSLAVQSKPNESPRPHYRRVALSGISVRLGEIGCEF
jgi:hypothetical protein